MVEGPGCKLKGEAMKPRIKGQFVQKVDGNAVDRTTKKPKKRKVNEEADNNGHNVEKGEVSPLQQLVGKKVTDVQTLGKELFIFFQDFDICLRVHFLMSGGFRLNGEKIDKDGGGEAQTASLRMHLTKDLLVFNKSGIELRPAQKTLERIKEFKSLDICDDTFSHKRAVELIRTQSERLVCDVLLDQVILPGVGNIIKNEAMFDSGIKPDSKIEELTDAHLSHLVNMTRDFSMIFYKCRKTGEPLNRYYKIYRKGKCGQCGGKVVNTKMGDSGERLTSFCPQCQNNDLKKSVLPSKNSLLGWIGGSKKETWECSQCTLVNQASRANCEVCLSPKSDKPKDECVKSQSRTKDLVKPPIGHHSTKTRNTAPNDVSIGKGKALRNSNIGQVNVSSSHKTGEKAKQVPNVNTPLCDQHKKKCKMIQVRKEGENHNRMFYSCSLPKNKQCRFFKWADESFPLCETHGKRTVLRTVMKQGQNNGRKFFACPLPKKTQCGFFEWADQYNSTEMS